jgi:2-dehydropantoate 2-reductase
MRALVMGAGAIGSVFGGFLAGAGHSVTLVGREPHMKQVREKGLRITGIWGDHEVAIERCFASAQGLADAGERFDLVLIAVKSHDTAAAAEAVRPLLTDESLVISLQNGLGNTEKIAERVGWERTLTGMVIFGVEHRHPGRVSVTVQADVVRIGAWRSQVDEERIDVLTRLIAAAGIQCEHSPDIQKYLWNKVLYNCALNPLATILGSTYGFLLTTEPTREIMRRVIDEAFQVAWAVRAEMFHETPEQYEQHLFENLIPPTAAHHPSMLQDIEKGKRTEIDALNGAIVRLGRENQITCRTNQTLVDLIHAIETTRGKNRPTVG